MCTILRKKFISGKFDVIKENVKYSKLLATVQVMKILSNEMIEKINSDTSGDESKFNKLLTQLIEHTGLYFLKDLVLKIVLETNYTCLDEVEKIFIDMLLIHDYYHILEPFDEPLLKYPNIELNVIKSSRFHKSYSSAIDVYRMQSKTRGVLFLVNNINFHKGTKIRKRSGAEYDKYYLIELHRGMGFKIYYLENLRCNDFTKYVDELIALHLDEVDCFVLALLTHGHESDEATFYDGETMSTKMILDLFSDTNCVVLKGKPKIFLLPYCRGAAPDFGVKYVTNIEADGYSSKSYCNDIIICYGTVEGYQTFRDPSCGSWFVQEYCNVLAGEAHEKDFETMMYRVKEKVMALRARVNNLQTPSVVSIDFNKILYFNPGYFGGELETKAYFNADVSGLKTHDN